MLKLFLWLRYLGKRRMVLLSIAAVALSCALLIVVASLFYGFINTFEQSTAEAIGDIVLIPPEKIGDYQGLIKKLEELENIEAATATLTTQGLLHLGNGNVRAVEIWGIDVEKEGKVTAFNKSLLKKGSESLPALGENIISSYVGIGILSEPNEETDEYDFESINQQTGREIILTTGSVSGKDTRELRRKTLRLVIADVVFTGVYTLDKRVVYVPIDKLCETLYPETKQSLAGQLAIKLKNGSDIGDSLRQIRGVWDKFASETLGWEPYKITTTRIETAIEIQARYLAEIQKQMGILLLIFGVISLSAILLIFCIFYMIVETHRKDIAIIKSCGASSVSVASLFVGFGVFVGVIGTLMGTAFGYIVTKNINAIEGWIRIAFGLKLWKASVYMFSRIPSEVDWHAVVWIGLSAIAGAAVGSLIPAISAAITKPVKVLRYE